MEYKYSDYPEVLIFIPVILYLIVHNLKIRRYASEDLSKYINSIFAGTMLVVTFLLLRPILWNSKFIFYIDIFLIFTFIFIIATVIVKKFNSMKEVFGKVFENKTSISESIFMTILLAAVFIFDNIWIWLIDFAVFSVFLLKEAYFMSYLYKMHNKDK